MAELRSKHAFGNSGNVESALNSGKIDAYDILYLDGDTNEPKIGWVNKEGKTVIVDTEKIVFFIISLSTACFTVIAEYLLMVGSSG